MLSGKTSEYALKSASLKKKIITYIFVGFFKASFIHYATSRENRHASFDSVNHWYYLLQYDSKPS